MIGIENLLSEYKTIEVQIKSVEIEIQALSNRLGSVPTMSYEEERVSTSRSISSSVENEVIKKEEREAELIRRKKSLELKKARIENAMSILNDRELEVVKLRYLTNNLSHQIIADKMFLSRPTISRTNKKALEKLKNMLYV